MSSELPAGVALRCKAARRLGCEVRDLDPETGYLYEIRRGGRRRILLGGFSPLNDAVAARIAQDKFHAAYLLGREGYRVPASARCLRPGHYTHEEFPAHTGIEPGRRFAEKHGYPLVVKPNRGSRGRDVGRVTDEAALVEAIERIWERDYLALAQELIPGIDLRLDFLDGDYLFGYLRRPLTVEGDGRSTVRRLLENIGPASLEAASRERHPDLETVPAARESVDLSGGILNLNRLCVAERLPAIDPEWSEYGSRIGEVLGLRHFGVDFRIASPGDPPTAAAILEVNASPSLVWMSRAYPEDAVAAEMRVVAAILEPDRPAT